MNMQTTQRNATIPNTLDLTGKESKPNTLSRTRAYREKCKLEHRCVDCGHDLEEGETRLSCEECRARQRRYYDYVKGEKIRKLGLEEKEDDVNVRYKARLHSYGLPDEIVEKVRC